jgi:spermidine synthase
MGIVRETVESDPASSSRVGWLVPLFATTIFASATLLFVVQPMVAKAILPLLGGTPAVWNTCMVFFQAVLLAGYLYAHLLVTRFAPPRQVLIHIGLLAAAGLMLPIDVTSAWSAWHEARPQLGVLALLASGVGLPFLALSATAPLLQAWFARTAHSSASDPYYLYAASNMGSMLALLSYPTLTEVFLPLEAQLHLWQLVYWVLAGLLVTSGLVALHHSRVAAVDDVADAQATAVPDRRVSLRERVLWIVLAFVPSSLMLGLTTYFTTDIASIPLFWVAPLVLYLLTFIIAFSRVGPSVMGIVAPLVPVAVAAILALSLSQAMWAIPLSVSIGLHLSAFIILALACHVRLAERRPSVRHLTDYYLLISVGGVLGGIFNALLSPVLFNSIFEYPLIAAAAAVVLAVDRLHRYEVPRCSAIFLVALTIGTVLLSAISAASRLDKISMAFIVPGAEALDLKPWEFSVVVMAVIGAALLLLAHWIGGRAASAGLAVAMMLATYALDLSGRDTLFQERSFFGVVKVYDDPDELRYFMHGTTIHGAQSRDADRAREPLTYYHKQGPVGHLWQALEANGSIRRIGVVGLGVGTLVSYGKPGQHFTFFEIDPIVAQVAKDPRLFTYLSNSTATYNIILGDARLKLRNAPDQSYDLLLLDAFSSDSIPLHLVSREAFRLYLAKLSPEGIIAMHISNRYMNLAPVVANLAADAGLVAYRWDDDEEDDEDPQSVGKRVSDWVIMARDQRQLANIARNGDWKKLQPNPEYPVWRDAHSNLLSIITW